MALKGAKAAGLLNNLGTELVTQTTERLRNEKAAPDGTPWHGWSKSYEKWRGSPEIGQNPGDGIGILTEHMQGEVAYNLINQYALEWGSSAEYAGYFNGEDLKDKSYARPFIGLSSSNEADLVDKAEDYLGRQGAAG